MDYIGLTEEELLDVVIDIEGEMESEKAKFDSRLRELGIRDEEIRKRMHHFEATFLIRRLISEKKTSSQDYSPRYRNLSLRH